MYWIQDRLDFVGTISVVMEGGLAYIQFRDCPGCGIRLNQIVTLKMEAVCYSETSENTCTTWHRNQKEDRSVSELLRFDYVSVLLCPNSQSQMETILLDSLHF